MSSDEGSGVTRRLEETVPTKRLVRLPGRLQPPKQALHQTRTPGVLIVVFFPPQTQPPERCLRLEGLFPAALPKCLAEGF